MSGSPCRAPARGARSNAAPIPGPVAARAALEASHRAEVERLFFVGDTPEGADEAEAEETEETEDGASFEFAEDVNWS